MFEILALIGGLVVFLFVFTRVALAYASYLTRLLVELPHQDIEYIIAARLPPERWSVSRCGVLIDRLAKLFGAPRRLRSSRPNSQARRRLNGLLSLARRSNLFADDASRQQVVNQLEDIGREWSEKMNVETEKSER